MLFVGLNWGTYKMPVGRGGGEHGGQGKKGDCNSFTLSHVQEA